jgi:hypothetical protein
VIKTHPPSGLGLQLNSNDLGRTDPFGKKNRDGFVTKLSHCASGAGSRITPGRVLHGPAIESEYSIVITPAAAGSPELVRAPPSAETSPRVGGDGGGQCPGGRKELQFVVAFPPILAQPMATMTKGPPGTLFTVGLWWNGGAITSAFLYGPLTTQQSQ